MTTRFPLRRVWIARTSRASPPARRPRVAQLSVRSNPTQVAIAGQAANWGDLFVLDEPHRIVDLDGDQRLGDGGQLRADGGQHRRRVSRSNGQLTLYAAGVNSPPPQGVGVYAIPSAKWTQAISDGWPIISETGGLGHAQRALGRLHRRDDRQRRRRTF